MASPSLYTDFVHFKEDSITTISYDQLSNFYASKGLSDRAKSMESASFPQQIEWEFGENIIIETHSIKSTDPVVFRYVYTGDFSYDPNSGNLTNAKFNQAASLFFDPDDGELYGYVYKPSSNVELNQASSFLSWEDATSDIFQDSNITEEHESYYGKEATKQGVIDNESFSQYYYSGWHKEPFGQNFLEFLPGEEDLYAREELVSASTWSSPVRINKELFASGLEAVLQAKQVDKSEYDSGFVGSIVTGTADDDIIRGLAGFDQLFGKAGDDLIHGGNGRDIIDGGSGSDELHGDFGWNTFLDQQDGSKDLIAIKSDQHLSNFWYGKAGNSPNGEKADFIEGLDATDEIKIIGVFTPDISVVDNVTARGVTGIGIYAKGTLEAVYTGGNLSTSQIQNMTTGDGSTTAMNNQMWSYWGDNTVPALQT